MCRFSESVMAQILQRNSIVPPAGGAKGVNQFTLHTRLIAAARPASDPPLTHNLPSYAPSDLMSHGAPKHEMVRKPPEKADVGRRLASRHSTRLGLGPFCSRRPGCLVLHPLRANSWVAAHKRTGLS